MSPSQSLELPAGSLKSSALPPWRRAQQQRGGRRHPAPQRTGPAERGARLRPRRGSPCPRVSRCGRGEHRRNLSASLSSASRHLSAMRSSGAPEAISIADALAAPSRPLALVAELEQFARPGALDDRASRTPSLQPPLGKRWLRREGGRGMPARRSEARYAGYRSFGQNWFLNLRP